MHLLVIILKLFHIYIYRHMTAKTFSALWQDSLAQRITVFFVSAFNNELDLHELTCFLHVMLYYITFTCHVILNSSMTCNTCIFFLKGLFHLGVFSDRVWSSCWRLIVLNFGLRPDRARSLSHLGVSSSERHHPRKHPGGIDPLEN